jgi:hypothetical protein
MSQWIISLNDNLDDEGSDNQHSAKWEDAQEKLQSTTHEPSQYHPAASSLSSAPVNQPVTPSNMNSQSITTVNNLQSPIVHTTVLNSNINAGRQQQQQYHRPLLKTVDGNLNKGIGNSSDGKESIIQPLTETLPFENYRIIDSTTRNNNYAGAKRLSDNDDDENGHDGDVDEEDEDNPGQSKHKSNEQNIFQSSRQSNLIGDSFSRNNSSSTFINTSTILMMMKGNEGETGEYLGGNQKQISKNGKSISSSSSSSLLFDEQQKLKPRRYNFIPVPFNGTRLIAKSTEQLNRSFTNDSLINYSTRSILKQKYPSSIIKPNLSKIIKCMPFLFD